MIRNLKSIVVTILMVSIPGWGQSTLSLTYPFGLPLRPLSSTALSMGGVSVGVPIDHHVMLSNPGNLGTIDITAFSSLLLIDYFRMHDNGSYTDHIQIIPRQISFALPIGRAGTLAFSLLKDTDATIKYRQDKIQHNSGDTLPVYTRVALDREGGITSWHAGWGHNFGKFVNIGIAYERVYFSINRTKLSHATFAKIEQVIDEDNNDTTTEESIIGESIIRDSSHYTFRGNGLRFGIMGTIKNLSIGIAGSYFFEGNLVYNNALYINNSSLPIHTKNVSTSEPSLQLPPSIDVGLSYAFSPKWLVGTDLSFELWKYYSLEGDSMLSEIDKTEIEQDNTVSLSAGFRFIPAPNLLAPKYWETIHFRAGVRYSQLPGNNSKEASGSFGFGFPLRGNGLLDIGFEIGKRTHEMYPDYDETFLQIAIGINGGRKWHKSTTSTY